MKQCPNCGNTVLDDAKFCVECGQPLSAEAPVTEAAPVEAAPVETAAEAPAAPAEPAAPVAKAPEAPVPVAVPAASQEAPADMPIVTQVPSRKQMLSTFQYILLTMLYGLPVIGLVFLFIFGAGHPKNVSLKRFSSAMLILRLVFWIVLLALLIVAMVKNGRLLSDALGQLIPAVTNLLKAIFA